MLEDISNYIHQITLSFGVVQTLIVAGVGFFAVTWAFSQIIFPRLKNLDVIQDELVAFGTKLDSLRNKFGDKDEAKEDKHAADLNNIFVKYETAHIRAIPMARIGSLIYVVLTSVFVLLASKNIYITIIYLIVLLVITFLILANYPSVNKVRSVKFLVKNIGFNPWIIWNLMQPSITFTSNLRNWMNNDNDEVHIVLKQRVFITDWKYYLQVSTADNTKIWLIASGVIKLNRSTDKSFTDYGIEHYRTLGKFNHALLEVPLNENIREFKAGLIVFTPVFKNDTFNPFHLNGFAEIKQDTRTFMAGKFTINNPSMSMTEAIEVRGVGKKFKVKLADSRNSMSVVDRDVFKKMKFALSRNTNLSISNKGGNLKEYLESDELFFIRILYFIYALIHLPNLRIGDFDKISKDLNKD